MAPASLSHLLVSSLKLPPALGGEAVEFGAAIVLGGAFFDRNPSALDEPVQRGIERSLLDLQHVVRVEFDGFGDGVAVRRAPGAACAESADPGCPAAARCDLFVL